MTMHLSPQTVHNLSIDAAILCLTVTLIMLGLLLGSQVMWVIGTLGLAIGIMVVLTHTLD